MAEDWESGHFLLVKPELPDAVVVASSIPLTRDELDNIIRPYGTVLKVEAARTTLGYAWRVSIEPHGVQTRD